MSRLVIGAVALEMLRKCAASPDGTALFRRGEVSKAAEKNGWVRLAEWRGRGVRLDTWEITDLGREVFATRGPL